MNRKSRQKVDAPDSYVASIAEIAEQADYRKNGPKYHTKCPDCGATVSVTKLENDRYELSFVEHAK